MLLQELDLERHPPAFGTDRDQCPPSVAPRCRRRGRGVREETLRGRKQRAELVLYERAEAGAHEDLRHPRVARLLQTLLEQRVCFAEHVRVEVALFHAGGVHQDEPVHAERCRSREDPPQGFRTWNREQKVDAGPRRWRVGQLHREHELIGRKSQNAPDSDEAAELSDAQTISFGRAQNLARMQESPPGEPDGAIRSEVRIVEQEKVHLWPAQPPIVFGYNVAVRLLQHRFAGPEPCPYLPGVASTTETLLMTGVSADDLEGLLERGWRRFGPVYFRPVCAGCEECVSVRVPVETFAPSVNLRRVLKRASHLRLEVGSPSLDEERLSLYRRWHAGREADRGWKPDAIGAEAYAMQFCFPHAAARELAYYDGDALVAVGIADETPHSVSAVYCYHDPDRAHLSLGTYNVLATIEYARERGLRHVYLGYCVEGCASLRYKARFRPQERLRGKVDAGQAPQWVPD
jgi:arginyl-tRNA--protein-N-Asp/Glu arginylyltransferase